MFKAESDWVKNEYVRSKTCCSVPGCCVNVVSLYD